MLQLPPYALMLIIACLLLLTAFFSASEIALFTFRKTRLALLVKQNNGKAKMIHNLMQRPEAILSTILIGNTVVTIASSVLATILALELFPQNGALVAMLVMSVLTIQFGEILPKALASQFWERVAFATVRPIRFFGWLFYPFVVLFSSVTRLFGRWLGIRIKYHQPLISRDELRHTVDIARDTGSLKEDETLILQNIFRFTDLTVHDVMLPREKAVLLNLNAKPEEILKVIVDTHHTRIPVYDGQPDNIVGILYTKEYLNVVCYGESGLIILHDLIRTPYLVADNRKISEVLRELQKNRQHLAVVKNKAGQFTGIITIEDILEEIVGEIMDEHDLQPAA